MFGSVIMITAVMTLGDSGDIAVIIVSSPGRQCVVVENNDRRGAVFPVLGDHVARVLARLPVSCMGRTDIPHTIRTR